MQHDWPALAEALARGCTLREIGTIAGVGERQSHRILRLIQACNLLAETIEPHGRKRWRLTREFVVPVERPNKEGAGLG